MLTFDELKHEYRIAGVVLPTVTQILQFWDLVPIYPSGPYRVRGKQVHKATHLHDEGFEFEQLGAEIAPYLESYRLALADWRFVWTGIEIRIYHPLLAYAGTIDRLGTQSRNPCVVDIKSGDTGKETELQTAGYVLGACTCPYTDGMLPKGVKPREVERYRIRLFKDGRKGDVVRYSNPLAYSAFEGLVAAYKFQVAK